MTPQEMDALLRESLADQRVSASEKKSLSERLAPLAGDEQKLAFLRSKAFDLAREAAPGAAVLDWLESIVKLTLKQPERKNEELALACFSPGDDCIQEIVRQFHNARRQCHICVFTITDDRITSAIESAHRRGVAVRIITDDEKSFDAGSDIDRLRRNGIRCLLDDSPAHMHHKFALFDGVRLLTGSFNWTRSATEQNEENLIVTSDPRLVGAFSSRFDLLWSKLER